MSKFYDLEKTSFEFNLLDTSNEFKESFDYVFQTYKTLFFVFKANVKNKKNVKEHVVEYYVKNRGYKKIKFLKQ